MDKIEQARLEQLEKCIPDVWDYKRVLYIGAYKERTHFFDAMKANNCIVDVVEIEEENCLWLLQTQRWLSCVMQLDVVDFLTLGPSEKYDMILWSHGPEVLAKEEAYNLLKDHIGKHVTKLIVLMAPNGEAGGTGNVCSFFPDEFKRLGYNTDCLGARGERNSNLLAWKYLGVKNAVD